LVVICSKYYPNLNGQTTVILSLENDMNSLDDDGKKLGGRIAYKTTNCGNWMQSALRKHHPPSPQTFAEIMEGLKQPVTRSV